jgi:t-SNARE complex subunit (syntaxin)
MINRKYSNDVDQKDKLNLIKGQMCKTLDKEIENFNKNAANFNTVKTNLSRKTEVDYNEGNSLLADNQDEDSQKYKVSDGQIKYYDDISKYRKGQIENIYSKVLMVQKITDEINLLTHQQDKKIEKIDDNVEPVLLNAKETFKKLLETSNEDKNFKTNNCCIILIIIFAVFFMILVLIQLNRD